MLCFIFLIALFLPSFALVEKQKKNENVTVCADPEIIKVGDEFFTCFDIEVNNSIRHENRHCNTWLPATILEYVRVTNKTCYNGTVNHERDAVEFYKFMKFSLNNNYFKDFMENGGLKCINEIKEKITHCVKNEVGTVQSHSKYHTLWKKTKLTIDVMSCKESNRLKTCVVNEIRSNYKCMYDYSNELYVSSLFNYMLNRCTKLVPEWKENNQMKPKEKPYQQFKDAVRTSNILLALLMTLMLVGIVYTIIRDCRTPNGRWKTFNEHFSMSQRRRRSLVNNEVCHGN